MHKTAVFLLFVLIAAAIAPQFAMAQAQGQGHGQSQGQPAQAPAAMPAPAFRWNSFIYAFPQTERYHLHLIGDGLAEGLFSGMQQAFEKDGSLRIINSSRPNTSLARPDRSNWGADIDDIIKTAPMHIAVIMVGMNDARNMRLSDGRWVKFGTDEWRTAYGKEVDKLIKALKDRYVAVYWVGLPVMSSPATNEAMGTLNDIIRERAYLSSGDGAHVKYIDTWSGFTDQSGKFSAFGPDLTGQTQRLREADGISFTARGNRKLANFVEVVLRRDLGEAKAERNIPLAGDEEEQSRLIPKAQATKDGKDVKDKNTVSWMPELKPGEDPGQKPAIKEQQPPQKGKDAGKPGANEPIAPQGPALAQPPVLQPSVRPTDGPPGEIIMGDMSDGVTSLATVSPLADLNATIDIGERRLPVSERQYYKALVKGEPLQPKPGRADDFKWPRS